MHMARIVDAGGRRWSGSARHIPARRCLLSAGGPCLCCRHCSPRRSAMHATVWPWHTRSVCVPDYVAIGCGPRPAQRYTAHGPPARPPGHAHARALMPRHARRPHRSLPRMRAQAPVLPRTDRTAKTADGRSGRRRHGCVYCADSDGPAEPVVCARHGPLEAQGRLRRRRLPRGPVPPAFREGCGGRRRRRGGSGRGEEEVGGRGWIERRQQARDETRRRRKFATTPKTRILPAARRRTRECDVQRAA